MTKKWIGLGVILLVLLGGFLFFQNTVDSFEKVGAEQFVEEAPAREYRYGIDITDLQILEGTVERNQTLGTILGEFAVPYPTIDVLAKDFKSIFDARSLAVGKKYTVLTPLDTTRAKFFIYEVNASEYVVYDLEKVNVLRAEKPAVFLTKEIGGTIQTSLYVDMSAQGIGPELIDLFADIFGWSVDFQRLQKGDTYKVAYKEKVVDGKPVGIEAINLAYFEHEGEPIHAIPFEQNGERSYFDQEGKSLKKAFLRDPLKYSRISSRYNLRRFHPVQKRYKPHLGTDYAAPRGTEIRSVGEGTVIAAGYTRGNGNYVKIKHNGTYTTQYLHMSKIGKGIKNGARIQQGQVIGYVGSTGLATGPHLCFRFWKHGKQVDWLQEKIPPSDPILPENLLAFESVKAAALEELASIPLSEPAEQLLAEEVDELEEPTTN